MAGVELMTTAHFESMLDLTATLLEARSPNSPGGCAVTDCEWEQALDQARAVTHEAEGLMVADKLVIQIRHRGLEMNKPMKIELRRFLRTGVQQKACSVSAPQALPTKSISAVESSHSHDKPVKAESQEAVTR